MWSWPLRRYWCAPLVWAVVGALASNAYADEVDRDAAHDSVARWRDSGLPLLREYCLDCHNEDYQEAGLDLSIIREVDGFAEEGELVRRVIVMVRFGAMPPGDAAQPDPDQRNTLADAMDALSRHVTCSTTPGGGHVTTRRLNRAEYNNAIRDLFGSDLRPADDFPADDVGGGFDNNGDVLSVTPMLLEKYLDAAERVAESVIIDVANLPRADTELTDASLSVIGESKKGRYGGRFIREGDIYHFAFEAPAGGRYQIQISGEPNDETFRKARMFGVYDDEGRLIERAAIKNRKGNGVSSHQFKLRLPSGRHRMFLIPTMETDETVKNDDDWKVGTSIHPRIAELTTEQVRQSVLPADTLLPIDRGIDQQKFAFAVRKIAVTGPEDSSRDDVPQRQRDLLPVVATYRSSDPDRVINAAIKNLKPIVRRAFREPVDEDEIRPYAELIVDPMRRGESFYAAMRVPLTAVLSSPRFLFRAELPPDQKKVNRGDTFELTPYQIASRLAFFVYCSVPDEDLFRYAANGRITEAKHRTELIDAMLDDPRSEALGREFISQWFGLKGLRERELADLRSEGLDAAMLESETVDLVMHLIRNNRPVSELLTADYTFADPALANYYGLNSDDNEPTDPSRMVKRSLVGSSRRGILGHAGVLTLTSYPNRNSPVLRGKWILENLIGTPPPDPPAGVPELDESSGSNDGGTLREQLERHRADASCASCHRVMDAMGFGLETFDHLGRVRDADDTDAMAAGGELPGGYTFRGAEELGRVLAETQVRTIAETATRRMMSFAIGRELRPADRCHVETILDSAASQGYRMKDLLLGVVNSPPFLTMTKP